MTQEIIVGLIVALAAAYVVWRFVPARWRKPLQRAHPALARESGCGGCSGCSSPSGGCGTHRQKAQ